MPRCSRRWRWHAAMGVMRGSSRAWRVSELLIRDDWELAPLTGEQRRDLLEIVDDRDQRGSTIITS
jgi:hypothetical protein